MTRLEYLASRGDRIAHAELERLEWRRTGISLAPLDLDDNWSHGEGWFAGDGGGGHPDGDGDGDQSWSDGWERVSANGDGGTAWQATGFWDGYGDGFGDFDGNGWGDGQGNG